MSVLVRHCRILPLAYISKLVSILFPILPFILPSSFLLFFSFFSYHHLGLPSDGTESKTYLTRPRLRCDNGMAAYYTKAKAISTAEKSNLKNKNKKVARVRTL